MWGKFKQLNKKIVMVMVATLLVSGIQVTPVQAATEADKEAFRQEVIEMLNEGDSSVHNVRQYNLTFSDYNTIFWDVVENECKVVYACYINQVPQSTKDGEYIDTFWLYNSDEGFKERYANMLASIEEVQSGLDDNMSELEKALYIHDWIVNHTYYKLDTFSRVPGGPLGLGYGVCAGYDATMRLLLGLEGIECTQIESANHAWLAIKLDGEWYHIDPTWDDTRSSVSGKVSHKYFLRNDEEFSSVCKHDSWKYAEGGGYENGAWQGTWVEKTLSTSTKYTNWYVHDIVGDMFYYGGYWYYVENGSIVKNNIEGTAYESVVSGSNLNIISLNDGVLSYNDNGTVCEKNLKDAGNTDDAGETGNSGNSGNVGETDNSGNSGNSGETDNSGNTGNTDNADNTDNGTTDGSEETQSGITVYNGVDYSLVYDFNYYCQKNPDIKAVYGNDDVGALRHFVKAGMSEGRQASANFDVKSYRNANVDLRLAYGNDLVKYYQHYMRSGKNEGRKTTGVTTIQNPVTSYGGVNYSLVYDFDYYCAKYPDIKKAYGNDDIAALRHFVKAGMSEGRQASANFDVQSYRNANVDLRLAYGNDLVKYYQHYLRSGKYEGRKTTGVTTIQNPVTSYGGVNYSSVYDYNYYCAKNPDVKAAYGNDDIAVLKHFIRSGMSEGRQANAEFNVQIYKSRYPDVKAAYGNNLKEYYLHYIRSGKSEGRSAK